MHAFYLTLDYTDVTDPHTGEPIRADDKALAQFCTELADAVDYWNDTLIGYRVVREQAARRRLVVRFITSPELSQAAAIAAAQLHLYDEGGLSGSFVYGVEQSYVVRVETEITVWATDQGDAEEQAANAHGVHRVVRVARTNA